MFKQYNFRRTILFSTVLSFKNWYGVPDFLQQACPVPNMKKITLEKIMWSLERMQPEVRVPEEIAAKARQAVERMVAIG